MSGVTYRYSHEEVRNHNGKKEKVSQSIIDGDKGLSIKYFSKTDKKFHMIFIRSSGDDKYSLTEKKDDKETTKEISLSDIKKMAKGDLSFIADYLKIKKGGAVSNDQNGGKRRSRRSSRKSMRGGGDQCGLKH